MMVDAAEHSEAGGATPSATVRVWDPMVRLFHWSLVALFAFCYLSAEEWGSAHINAGYAVAALIFFRVIWGLIGSRHARFSDFVYSPATVAKFVGDTMLMRARRYIGHNPAGGVMVIALLVMVAVISTTGFMMTTDAYWGIEWVSDLHSLSVDVTIGLIMLHIAGVVFASIEHKENLVRSMFTGRKRPN